MSHPREKILTFPWWRCLLTLLLSTSLSWIFSAVFLDRGQLLFSFLYCVFFSAYIFLVESFPKKAFRWGLLLGTAGLETVLFFFRRGIIFSCWEGIKSLVSGFSSLSGPGPFFAPEIRILFSLIFTLLSYFLMREEQFAFSGTVVLLLLSLALGWKDQSHFLILSLPCAAALVLLLGSGQEKKGKLLFVSGIVVLLSFLLVPKEGTTLPSMAEAAREIRNTAEDYFFFTKERDAFSMHREGWQPQGERLGGPVSPKSIPALQVKGPENSTIYLRASTYNEYTGLNWYDTLSARRYLLHSSSYEKIKKEVLSLDRPILGDRTSDQVTVTLLREDTTTLFVPERQREIVTLSDRMVPYFNTAGEIYITRNLREGDAYQVSYLPFSLYDEKTPELISRNASVYDPYFASVSQNYLTVPRHIQKEVWDIAEKVTEGIEDPLEKAEAIRHFLMTEYRYTLDVQVPPSSVDFAAYFLLGEKEGYCTYFATAQTILCRMAGIPARYATGFLARTDAQGQALVTSREAHAWTEIYLNGFGWLTLDATPGEHQNLPSGHGGENPPPSDPGSSPSPSPSPSPQAKNQEENEGETTPPPENQPSPEASFTPPFDSTPDIPDEPGKHSEPASSFPFLLILFLLLLLTAMILWYFVREPVRRGRRYPGKAGDIYFYHICLLISCMGYRRKKDETYRSYGERLQKAGFSDALPELFEEAGARIYGKNYRIDSRLSKDIYLEIRRSAGKAARFKAGFLRYFSLKG